MPEQVTTELPRIAFVFWDGGEAACEHVREAIGEQANIVYTTAAKDFDGMRLTDSGASAALVNVDGGDWLESLEARLNAAGVKVVFNDPELSRSLDGWERARWLRHLSAKLRGSADVDPPRPAPGAVAASLSASTDRAARQPANAAPEDAAGFPLSEHEIATMTADFSNPETASAGAIKVAHANEANGEVAPGAEGGTSDVDTEALSAMIDARLAEVTASEQAFQAGDSPGATSSSVANAGKRAAPVGDDAGLDSLPSLDDWSLVDSESGATSASAPKREVVEPTLPDSLAGLELMPMETHAPAKPMEPIERWIDDTDTKPKPKSDGDKA